MQYSYTVHVGSGASTSCAINAEAGDWILATVSLRSDPTYPAGWTLLHQTAYVYPDQTYKQCMAFLCKKVTESGSVTFSLSQSGTGTMWINLIALKGVLSIRYNPGTEHVTTQNPQTFTRPATVCLVWGCSAVYLNTQDAYKFWKCTQLPNTRICQDGTNARLANFVDDADFAARTFTQPLATTESHDALVDCVEVICETNGAAFETTSGTSLTAAINANADDWVLATVVTRSATTYPSGWTLLGVGTALELDQRMAFLCKKASALERVSCIVTQATAGRIYTNLITCAGIIGFAYGTETVEAGAAVTADRPAGDLIIWGVHRSYWSTAVPYGAWSCAQIADSPICLDQATAQPRLANFIDRGSPGPRTFEQSATGNTSAAAYVIALTTQYVTHGEAVWEITDIRSMEHIYSSAIRWQASVPDGSTVTVQTKLDGGTYQTVSNGGPALSSFPDDLTSATLYVKVSLDTNNVYLSPRFSGLELTFITTESRRNLLLLFASGTVGSFRNAAGNITLTYDGAGGLEGEGGPVEDFEETFAPIGLVPKPNQNDAEHIELSLTAVGTLTRIYYTNAQEREHISLAVSASGVLTHVDDL